MTYTRESLNTAISLKLKDISQASGMHRGLFAITQLSGVTAIVGGVLIAPVALEVAAITAVAGLLSYGLSQLVQTKRTGHLAPLPGIPVSAGQLGYLPAKLAAHIMGGHEPLAPAPVRILPADYLPDKEKRISYLLANAADLIIDAAEKAQDGISFSAIVDMAVRASEYAITDEQLNNPITANKLAGEVRAVLMGDTSGIEAQQASAIEAEWHQAQADHDAGRISDDEFNQIWAEVAAIAPGLKKDNHAISPAPATGHGDLSQTVHHGTPASGARTDWQAVFALIKDQDTYPAIVIIGPQGTGKTTLINYLLSILKYHKIVLDPHYKMGDWPGCRVIGAGMNYRAVSDALANISANVAERYKQRACDKRYKPMPVTLVLEEQTNWAGKVPGAGKFLKETLSDIRKVGYRSISVAHAATNTARGGASGTAQMRKEGELSITLIEKGLAKVSLKGLETFMLRYPDPSPFIENHGEPDIAADGDLGPAFCGEDYQDPKPWKAGEQTVIDVDTVEAISPAEPTSLPSRWDKFRQQSADYCHMVAMANWLEARETPFTLRQLSQVKTLRAKFSAAEPNIPVATAMKAALNVFIRWEFVGQSDDGYHVLP